MLQAQQAGVAVTLSSTAALLLLLVVKLLLLLLLLLMVMLLLLLLLMVMLLLLLLLLLLRVSQVVVGQLALRPTLPAVAVAVGLVCRLWWVRCRGRLVP